MTSIKASSVLLGLLDNNIVMCGSRQAANTEHTICNQI